VTPHTAHMLGLLALAFLVLFVEALALSLQPRSRNGSAKASSSF
jgi:hypothetical protein